VQPATRLSAPLAANSPLHSWSESGPASSTRWTRDPFGRLDPADEGSHRSVVAPANPGSHHAWSEVGLTTRGRKSGKERTVPL